MDIKELDIKAKENEVISYALPNYQMAYYQASRYLYKAYEIGYLTLEECKKEKAEIIKRYEEDKVLYDLFLKLIPIQKKLEKLKAQGFNTILEWEILEDINEFLEY